MKDLVEVIAKALVDNPDEVTVTEKTEGKTEGKHCSVCNAVIVAQTHIPATGHNVTNWIDNGNETHSGKCTKCQQNQTESCNRAKSRTGSSCDWFPRFLRWTIRGEP